MAAYRHLTALLLITVVASSSLEELVGLQVQDVAASAESRGKPAPRSSMASKPSKVDDMKAESVDAIVHKWAKVDDMKAESVDAIVHKWGSIFDESKYEKERLDEKLQTAEEKRLAERKEIAEKKQLAEQQRLDAKLKKKQDEDKTKPFKSATGRVLRDEDWGIDWAKLSAQTKGKGETEMVSASAASAGYDLALKAEGVAGGDQCTLPDGILKNLIRSEESGEAKFGMLSLMELMDESTRKPFTYLRWGPDEWDCALGLSSKSKQETKIEEAMCDQLMEDFRDFGNAPSRFMPKASNLFLGIGTGYLCKESNPKLHRDVKMFLADGVLNPKFHGFLDSFYFPLLPSKETAALFKARPVPLLYRRKVVVVGPQYAKHLVGLTQHVAHINLMQNLHSQMPTTASLWQEHGSIIEQMREASDTFPLDNVVFLVIGDLSSKSLIYRAYRNLGHKDTIIDMGSALDLFAGRERQERNWNLHMVCNYYPQYVGPEVCINYAKRHAHAAA